MVSQIQNALKTEKKKEKRKKRKPVPWFEYCQLDGKKKMAQILSLIERKIRKVNNTICEVREWITK